VRFRRRKNWFRWKTLFRMRSKERNFRLHISECGSFVVELKLRAFSIRAKFACLLASERLANQSRPTFHIPLGETHLCSFYIKGHRTHLIDVTQIKTFFETFRYKMFRALNRFANRSWQKSIKYNVSWNFRKKLNINSTNYDTRKHIYQYDSKKTSNAFSNNK